MDCNKLNAYLDDVRNTLKLDGFSTSEHVNGSDLLQEFIDEMFGISFLKDCLEKGIDCQKRYLENNIQELSKKTTPEKIFNEFSSLYDNADVLYIAAYEKFLYFIAHCSSRFLNNNTRFLYDSKARLELSYTELVKGLENQTLLSMAVNFKLCKARSFELVTNSEHWIKLMRSFGIEITDNEESFFKLIHFRRNAASHYHLKEQWKELSTDIKHRETLYWLYGLIVFAVKVDNVLLENDPSRTFVQLNLFERGRYKFGV